MAADSPWFLALQTTTILIHYASNLIAHARPRRLRPSLLPPRAAGGVPRRPVPRATGATFRPQAEELLPVALCAAD